MSLTALQPPTPEQERREDAAAECRDDALEPFAVAEETCAQPVYEDIEHFETFKEILCALPVQHATASEIEAPAELLTRLLGKISPEFLEGVGELRAAAHNLHEDVDWAEMMSLAAQVGSTTPQPFFNKLLTPEESPTAPFSNHYKCELDYLIAADKLSVGRKFNVIGVLLELAGSYIHRVRAEWTAALIKLIHLCVAVFKPSMRGAVGTRATLEKRREAAAATVAVYNQPHVALQNFVRGNFFDLDVFIYETLTHLALPELRLSGQHIMLDAICLAEYHAVRCAIDAASSSILYICLMSADYINLVWDRYMRMYFPRMFVPFNETEQSRAYLESTTLPKWKQLVFYLPSEHQCPLPNPKHFIPVLQDYFSRWLTPEFRASFATVTTPADYTLLRAPPGEIFTVCTESTLAGRRSKRTCVTSTASPTLKRTRTK